MAKKVPALPAHPYVLEAVSILKSRAQTVSFAESCTGGLLSAVFTRMPGVSDVFSGSVVSYSNTVKERVLSVPNSMLRSLGAVSKPVVQKMACGVREIMGTTWAVGITGIAGPGGGTVEKPVGTVYFAIVGPGVEKTFLRRFSGARRDIQILSARFALRILLRELGSDLGSDLGSQTGAQFLKVFKGQKSRNAKKGLKKR